MTYGASGPQCTWPIVSVIVGALGGTTACGARSDLGEAEGVESPSNTASTSGAGHGGGSETGGGGGGGAGTTCTPATSDVFDPREVYFVSDGPSVVAHWCDPEISAAGFESQPSEVAIRPTDGRLVFYEFSLYGLLEFRCDACPFTGAPFPDDAWLNDVPIPTPGCDQVRGILMSPEGEIITQCGDNPPIYLDSSGVVLYPTADSVEPILLHVGYGGVGLTESFVVVFSAGVSTPIVGLPEGIRGPVRAAAEGGFDLAWAHEGVTSLFHITSAGSAGIVGDYPAPPAPDVFVFEDLAWTGALDAERRFFQFGEYANQPVLVRRDLSGVSVVVHDDGTDPFIKIGFATLVTGP